MVLKPGAGKTDKIARDTSRQQFFVVHLSMGRVSGVETATSRIRYVRFDGDKAQVFHDRFCRLSTTLNAEGYDAAGAFGHILLRQIVVFVGFQAREVNPSDFFVVFKELRHLLRVETMSFHAHVKAFEPEVEIVGALRGLTAPEVTHKLRRAFGDKSAFFTEFFRVGDSVITLVRGAQPREFLRVRHPVEFTAVDDTATDG